jgi:hypothetical protein
VAILLMIIGGYYIGGYYIGGLRCPILLVDISAY